MDAVRSPGTAVDIVAAALRARDRLQDMIDGLTARRIEIDRAEILQRISSAFAEFDALHPEKMLSPMLSYSIPAHAKWCQPGDMQDKRYFLVRFDDPDRGDAVFTSEEEARFFYGRATVSWNCWLFGALPAHPEKIGIEALKTAFEGVQYAPGDSPVVPVKIAAFMTFVGEWLAAATVASLA